MTSQIAHAVTEMRVRARDVVAGAAQHAKSAGLVTGDASEVAAQVGKLRKTNQDQASALTTLASALAGAATDDMPKTTAEQE